jgi:hypothetical protein
MTARSDESNSADLVARSVRSLRRCRTRFLLLALVLQGGACATAIYPGPKRPSSELATIEARGVAIEEIDGIDVFRKGSRFAVLPGDHLMVVEVAQVRPVGIFPAGSAWLSVKTVTHSGAMPICVSAKRNHSYVLLPRAPGALVPPLIYEDPPNVLVAPCGPAAAYHRDDFACAGALAEETLVSGLQKVSGCGIENVYGYDPARDEWQSVTERAIYDLNCPGHDLAVHHLGGTAVSVTGCGRRADYVASTPCAGGLCSFQAWVPNTAAPR